MCASRRRFNFGWSFLGWIPAFLYFPSDVDIRNGAVEGNAAQCKGKAAVVMCNSVNIISEKHHYSRAGKDVSPKIFQVVCSDSSCGR